jgi:hypothetical protein
MTEPVVHNLGNPFPEYGITGIKDLSRRTLNGIEGTYAEVYLADALSTAYVYLDNLPSEDQDRFHTALRIVKEVVTKKLLHDLDLAAKNRREERSRDEPPALVED